MEPSFPPLYIDHKNDSTKMSNMIKSTCKYDDKINHGVNDDVSTHHLIDHENIMLVLNDLKSKLKSERKYYTACMKYLENEIEDLEKEKESIKTTLERKVEIMEGNEKSLKDELEEFRNFKKTIIDTLIFENTKCSELIINLKQKCVSLEKEYNDKISDLKKEVDLRECANEIHDWFQTEKHSLHLQLQEVQENLKLLENKFNTLKMENHNLCVKLSEKEQKLEKQFELIKCLHNQQFILSNQANKNTVGISFREHPEVHFNHVSEQLNISPKITASSVDEKEYLLNENSRLKTQNNFLEEENKRLKFILQTNIEFNESMEDSYFKLAMEYAEHVGHQNLKQRIKYVTKLKRENNKFMKENLDLRKQNKILRMQSNNCD